MNYEILCGIHSVVEALKAKRRFFSTIYISKDRTLSRLNETLELAEANQTDVEFVSAGHLDQISNRIKHQGIAAKVSPFPVKKAEDELKHWDNESLLKDKDIKKFIVVLESIEDPHNLGAIVRTAICAGVDHIVIPKDRAVQPSPAVSRASAGAMEHADIHTVTNTASYLKTLKKKGVWVAGLDADGNKPLFSADLTDNIAIVVGGEHQGIRPLVKKECDFLLSLPLAKAIRSTSTPASKDTIISTEGITSLNASVACGIAMYEVVRQRSYHFKQK